MFSGLLVLLKLGIAVDKYYASEIDPDALMVSATHFGDRVIHLGNVKGITKEKIKEIAPIDLLIGGSPCNDLSLANPARLGLHGLHSHIKMHYHTYIFVYKCYKNEIKISKIASFRNYIFVPN